jgi:multiple sugar transport system substrate-binding protein
MMGKKSRGTAIVAVSVVLLGVVSACGSSTKSAAGNSTTGTSKSTATSSAKVHLTYSLWDTQEEIGYKKSIAKFEKMHPNISVTVEEIAYPEYETKLQEEFTSGGGPDVFWVNTPWVPTWQKDGLMLNLAPYVKKADVKISEFDPELITLYSHGGAIDALPKEGNTVAFIYNKAYFKKHNIVVPHNLAWSPTDGGSFLHFLRELTIDKSGNNALSAKFDPSSVATYATEISNSYETGWGNFLAEDGGNLMAPYASTANLDTPKGVSTLEFINQLMYKDHVVIPGSELGANAEDPSSEDTQLFSSGKIAMILEGSWQTQPIVGSSKFGVGTIELPAGPDGIGTVTNGGADAINPHGKNVQASWELESWLDSPASQKILGGGGFLWPSIESVRSSFTAYWTKHGVNMSGFTDEADLKANVLFPETAGMDQGLTDMGSDMGPMFLGAESSAQIAAQLASAQKSADHDVSAAGG